jgi:hypothetical protein
VVVDPAVCVAVARERLVRCEGWRERYVGFVLPEDDSCLTHQATASHLFYLFI